MLSFMLLSSFSELKISEDSGRLAWRAARCWYCTSFKSFTITFSTETLLPSSFCRSRARDMNSNSEYVKCVDDAVLEIKSIRVHLARFDIAIEF